jgi:hypothetical protein
MLIQIPLFAFAVPTRQMHLSNQKANRQGGEWRQKKGKILQELEEYNSKLPCFAPSQIPSPLSHFESKKKVSLWPGNTSQRTV